MSVKLLTEQHLEFLSLKGGCTGSSESTLVKMPHCWKSHAATHIIFTLISIQLVPIKQGKTRPCSTFFKQQTHRSWFTLIAFSTPYQVVKSTVKPVLSGHSKRRPKLVFETDYHLMQVKSIAECSKRSILQYFRPLISYHLSLTSLFCLFLSGRLRQVLLYLLKISVTFVTDEVSINVL